MTNSKNEVASQARPGYFLVRPTGQVVPLIAADELPAEITLQGISKNLEIEETVGMLNLGVVHPLNTSYQLLEKSHKPSNSNIDQATQNTESPNNSPNPSPSITAPANSPKSTTPKPEKSSSHPQQLKPNPVCKHWCAYGACKWGEHCRYLHSMPTTRAALHEAGLYDWPTWYRAQNPGMFNVLRRRGPVARQRMIPSARQSVVKDGKVVRFRERDVVKVLGEKLGEKDGGEGVGDKTDGKTEAIMVKKKDCAKEMPLVEL